MVGYVNKEYVNSFPFDPTEFPFNIEVSGITNYDNQYIINRENSYCYILEYICEGSGTLLCNGTKFHVSKGDVYLLPKGSNHKYYADDTWEKIWFNVDGILVSSLIYSYGLENSIVFHNFNERSLFDALYEITCKKIPTKDIMLSASMYFHQIMQHLYTFNQGLYNNKVNTIKQILDTSLYERNVSIKGIAKKLSLSQTQVISLFKNAFDMTPYQYFSKRRIELAAELLLNSNMQVKEIAEMLNYTDQPYFSNLFRKTWGVSPEKYRKNGINSNLKRSNINNKRLTEKNDEFPFKLEVNRH